MFSFNVSTGSVEVNYTNSKWYLGNAGATGFYRTYYDKSNYIALLKLLENDHEVHTHTHTHTQLPLTYTTKLIMCRFSRCRIYC